MNIGSLYLVKKYYWLLFSTKEIAATAALAPASNAVAAAWYSTLFHCEVTYFSPDSIVVFLENDGKLKKVLTSEGKIGWICFAEECNDCFEELKAEP